MGTVVIRIVVTVTPDPPCGPLLTRYIGLCYEDNTTSFSKQIHNLYTRKPWH